jgi:hypothetical protein
MQRNNNSTVPKKSYCKVCHDAGKSESEYTTHYVRSLPDRNGKSTVTCPILLAIECKYCHNSGHTIKYCPVIIKNKKNEENALKKMNSQCQQQSEMNKKKAESQHKKNVSGFNALYIDSDDEDDAAAPPKSNGKHVTIKDEFPALCPAKPVQPLVTGWASILTKSASASSTIQSKLPVAAATAAVDDTKKQVIHIKRDFPVRKSWADWSDSDTGDEDDDDEEDEDKGEFPSFLESPPNFYNDYS